MKRLCILLSAALFMAATATGSERVEKDLVALYDFEDDGGTAVRDRSEVEPALDLQISTPKTVRWTSGALVIEGSANVASADKAAKIITACQRSGELTIEAWIKPENNAQTGPARIVSISADTTRRNVTLAQDGAKYDVRLRAESTSENGLPSLNTADGSLKTELTHVVYTRTAAGQATFYLNGKGDATKDVSGKLSNWSGDFRLLLGNELTGDRPWRGELHLVALYSRALSERDVAQNFAAGVDVSAIHYAAMLPPAVDRKVDFVKDVQPILRAACFECHAEGNEEGGLNLGIKSRALEGGEHGRPWTAGQSAKSRLVHLVAGVEPKKLMPPEGDQLSKEQIGILRAWIDQGAVWPDGADVLNPKVERARKHWAFQKLAAVEPPAVANQAWPRTPIDRFVLASLEAKGLSPSDPIALRKLVRRVYFDVVGLPPPPEEVDAICVAKDPHAAYEALVNRLLASPHYGERWGRHWLDVARYADSNGQEADQDRPHAWRYRDFVIEELNNDMPVDKFLRWQLAGDEYEPDNVNACVATGFLTAGTHTVLENTFLEEERLRNRYNELDDMLGTVGTGMLGLTIGCARCHDHKYDAIPARDYYRMLSALHSGDRQDVKLGPSNVEALVFRDSGSEPKTTWQFGRGDFYDRKRPVTLGFLEIFTTHRTAEDYWKEARPASGAANTTYQRKAMARWLTDVENGAGAIVARVMVNRVWQHHFGEGLVRTPGDFGVRSEPPSHPALLEWLGSDLVNNGWKLKRVHRQILTSAVYQQAAAYDETKAKIDPDNRLLWRMRPRRVEAEILRDAMLEVSGQLNRQTLGPPFKPPISSEAQVARNLKSPYPADVKDGPDNHRRSIYIFQKRVIPYPLLAAFDRPDSQQSCSRRDATTVAPQALALLNDPFVRARSLDFADRLMRETKDDEANAIRRAFSLALGRAPSDTEQTAATEFLTAQTHSRRQRDGKLSPADAHRLALADFCQTMFGLNEFIYVD
jgi:hypothetical protein